jgi:predicted nucleic acid-binding protein
LGDKKRPLALGALQALLARVEFVPVLFSVRPMSPDPDDDLVVDCAFNARAAIVTRNAKDFRGFEAALGIVVLSPEEFCDHLRRT